MGYQADDQAALRTKVSKERIGIEITKMLAISPLSSLHLIANLGLHSSIFTCPGLPASEEPTEPHRALSLRTLEALNIVRQRWTELGAVEGSDYTWMAAALQPFEGKVVVGKKEIPAVAVCVSEGMKVKSLLHPS